MNTLEDSRQAQGDEQHHDTADAVDEGPAIGLDGSRLVGVGAMAAEDYEDAE